ncbi:MAG: universal stress protein [Candidatus Omnitrophica bacterium]|nr:universal stress protein [Candidatus Omnitrophota bacterium]
MYKKILIPLENSEYDTVILGHIKLLAKEFRAELILVHVADGYGARMQKQLNLVDSEEIKNDRSYLEKQKNKLINEGFIVTSFLQRGEPSDEILKIAVREQCDLIAMATHGHRFIKDIIFGSVAENIRHRTNIPILMVKSQKNFT